MASRETFAGDRLGIDDVENPVWEPLESALSVDLVMSCFMWMHSEPLAAGGRVHAYKHRWTRRYVHLTEDGRALHRTGNARWKVVDRESAVLDALNVGASAGDLEG